MGIGGKLLTLAALGTLAFAGASSASPYRQVFAFQGVDGAAPFASLIKVGKTLYGTTGIGGTKGCNTGSCGIVFTISLKSGHETAVHEFKNTSGNYPVAGLLDAGGGLYGTTYYGGTGGYGTVYSVNKKTGAEAVVYSFQGGSDGAGPEGTLLEVNGMFFGTTLNGGTDNRGTVFAVNPTTGAEKVIYSFQGGADGAFPSAGLIAVNGTIYGTTGRGGSASLCRNDGCGTVFSVDAATGTEKMIYVFQGSNDGAFPSAGLLSAGNTLYGTTEEGGAGNCSQMNGTGCGTVFSLNPTTGVESVVYSFKGGGDGIAPQAGLINLNGTFYGTTSLSGMGSGTIFSLNPMTGAETVLHTFKGGTDGAVPVAALINVSGTLYGTTSSGGTRACDGGCGTVFSYTPSL